MIGARADAPQTTNKESETQDLLYLAPRAPIFVRLRIRIEGNGLRMQRETYAKELFKKLDTSGDGLLQDAELEAIPPAGHLVPIGSNNTRASVARFGSADANEDKTVTPEEFTAYILKASGAPFQINTEVQQTSGGQNVELFERLDRNHDNRLTDDELEQAARNLRLMDEDLDERIGAQEITIPSIFGTADEDENSPASQATAALALFEPINKSYVDDSLIRNMVNLYDKLSRGPTRRRFIKDGQLSAKELGMDVAAISAFDRNQDGLLNHQELREFLANPKPAFEIVIEFGKESETPSIKLIAQEKLPQTAPVGVKTTQDNKLALLLNNAEFEIKASPKVDPVRIASQLKRPFSSFDNDQNKYLDSNELRFGGLGLSENHFGLVDTDGDGMVVEEEFSSFVKQQSELQKQVVSLGLANPSRTLHSYVDTSGDGMLDENELAALKSRILELDHNHDGAFERNELSGKLQLVLARGNVNIGQAALNPGVVYGGNPIPVDRQTAKNQSVWFIKMDRNQDRKIKKREFLGPLSVFDELDADKNGWIDPTEAKAKP